MLSKARTEVAPDLNGITHGIIAAAIEVHRQFLKDGIKRVVHEYAERGPDNAC
jgi:hypothetical protein